MISFIHPSHPAHCLPLVPLTSPLDTVLEEIRGQLGALLLVVVGIGAVFVRVPLGGGGKLEPRVLRRHRGRVQVAAVARLLALAVSRTGALSWRRATGTVVLGSAGTA